MEAELRTDEGGGLSKTEELVTLGELAQTISALSSRYREVRNLEGEAQVDALMAVMAHEQSCSRR